MSNQSALGPVQLDSTNTSVTILTLGKAGLVGLQVTANTNLTFSISGSQDGSTFTDLPATEQGGTAYAEAATITAAAGQLIYIPAASLGAVKITRVAGTGTIALRASHSSYLDALAAGGVSLGVVDTEFPTAAALNGTWAKTTVAPIAGAATMLNDGTNLILAVGGAGAVSTGVQRVTLASDDPGVTSLGLVDNLVGQEYETVAASQTAQVLGPTGAAGDLINGVLIVPGTTSPGNVLLLDNATSITIFTGGASSVSNLVPFFVPLGIRSVSGAWKITTGANVTAIGVGDFT